MRFNATSVAGAAQPQRLHGLAADIDRAVALALPHRIRRQPLQDMVMDVGSLLGSKCTTN